MDKDTRNAIERTTQRARGLLEEDFAAQLEGEFDVQRTGVVAAKPGSHLDPRRAAQRERIVASIEHKRAAGMSAAEAVADYLRDAAFTTLNRFVALKMLEARGLLQECITKGEDSAGYREFCGLAPGLPLLPDSAGYRLYIESLFDELSTEIKVLFDRRDPASVLWPRRATFEALLTLVNGAELAGVWDEDETIGWVYQYFNGADERRRMREESSAPRTSRELAVRNQFFTPRYVVQFLTDNTLGRIWYEMRGGKTVLAEKCGYMVRKPDEEYAPRAQKDPRDLRVLDPACGSGHFLLYAFDLLLAIYEEAYTAPESPKSEATSKTLAEDYQSLDALRGAVPRLVLAHNLHGVDIDPRCAQIAQLALWMRAQNAYRDFGIGRGTREQIRRSNIVVAEPLVANEQITREFVAKLGDADLGRVFLSLVESLNLAGDLGLLLPVEQLVAWQTARGETGDLFAPPEERIRAALALFMSEQGLSDTRRRLFVDDAAHGLGLVELSLGRFDVVLMNPPFGEPTPRAKAVLRTLKSDGWKDIYAGFFELADRLTGDSGFVGAITSSQYFYTRQLRSLRETWVSRRRVRCLVDLGAGVLDDAAVQTALAVLGPGRAPDLVYVDLFDEPAKDSLLGTVIRDGGLSSLSLSDLEMVPGIPFCLHATPTILHQWRTDATFDPTSGTVATGNHTFDDERFLRLRFEVRASEVGSTWRTFEKGGEYQPFFAAPRLVVQWRDDGAELRALNLEKYGTEAQVLQSSKFWGQLGICYTHVSSIGFSPRLLPPGIIFSSESIGVFPKEGKAESRKRLLGLLAFLASTAAQELIWVFGRFRKIENRAVSGLPISFRRLGPFLDRLAPLAQRGLELTMALEALDETTAIFASPDLFVDGSAEGVARQQIAKSLEGVYDDLDRCVATMLELSGDDIRAPRRSTLVSKFALDRIARNAEERAADAIMWLVGVLFGRWKRLPSQAMTLDLLRDEIPTVAPGESTEGVAMGGRTVLVDDEGHQSDISSLLLSTFDECAAQSLTSSVARALPRQSLREWVRSRLFAHHLGRYSAFTRKAPIYWQLATTSATYSVWLYIHAFSKDTFFRVQNDFVSPKLGHEERRLATLARELNDSGTAAQRKALAAQETFVEELRAFLGEVKRVAPLWNPDLDDGVIINFAPLWRLVPQHKAWQKELKATWDALCEGEYDWSHLAMHLWPERVVPKCATDRSFAIAHGLEEVFWVEGSDGKWVARKTPTRPIDELVRERTSAAVKAALKSLLEAPPLTGSNGARKGGRRRAAAALGEEA